MAEPEPTTLNGDESFDVDDAFLDDGRSSSLSEIDSDDASEDDDDDDDLPDKKTTPAVHENESEAETERVDDSPNNVRAKEDVVLSVGAGGAAAPGPSPSKLAQSTTYDDVEAEAEDDEEDDDDEEDAVHSPSKPGRQSSKNDRGMGTPQIIEEDLSATTSKKRKRQGSEEDATTDADRDEGLKKRRGSVRSDLSAAERAETGTPLSPHPVDDVHESTPAEDSHHDLDLAKANKKGKQSKRKGKKGDEGEEDDHGEEDETGERGDEADDTETAKHEEECKLNSTN